MATAAWWQVRGRQPISCKPRPISITRRKCCRRDPSRPLQRHDSAKPRESLRSRYFGSNLDPRRLDETHDHAQRTGYPGNVDLDQPPLPIGLQTTSGPVMLWPDRPALSYINL